MSSMRIRPIFSYLRILGICTGPETKQIVEYLLKGNCGGSNVVSRMQYLVDGLPCSSISWRHESGLRIMFPDSNENHLYP